MMKQLLFGALLLSHVCFAQSYKEAMDKCSAAFLSRLDAGSGRDQMQVFDDFNKCVGGLKFPSFTVKGIDGKDYYLDSLKGKVVLINLWFIGCPPCVAEIPTFNELTKEFGDQFVILSFARDEEKQLHQFIEKKPIDFVVLANSDKLITKTFRINLGYPTNIFLNKQGEIVELKVGGAMSEPGLTRAKESMRELIKSELSK